MYFFYLGFLVEFFMQALIVYKIVRDNDYECSSSMHMTLNILMYWAALVMPGVPQALFIGLMWQLSRIANEHEEYSTMK